MSRPPQCDEPDAFDRSGSDSFLSWVDKARRKTTPNKRERRKIRAILNPKPWREVYREYITSDHWLKFREKILATRGDMCESCGVSGLPVQLHHLTYVRLRRELPEDVKVLCDPCHGKRHMDRRTKISDGTETKLKTTGRTF